MITFYSIKNYQTSLLSVMSGEQKELKVKRQGYICKRKCLVYNGGLDLGSKFTKAFDASLSGPPTKSTGPI